MKRSRADDEEEVVPSIASKRTRDDEEEIVPSTSSASASAGHDNEEYASESKDAADDNIGGSRTPVCVCL